MIYSFANDLTPVPFPNGKGCLLAGVMVNNRLFDEFVRLQMLSKRMLMSNPNGGGKRGGEGATYPPALPKWEGGWSVDSFVDFPRIILFEDVLASPPWGRRERGFVLDSFNWEYVRLTDI